MNLGSDQLAGGLDGSTNDLYQVLRAIAQEHMRGERAGHTLQATAVVHEAYLRLSGLDASAWSDQNHFLSIAVRTIRRVLVDHARGHGRGKRGGDARPLTLHSGIEGVATEPIDVLALHDALDRLAEKDEDYVRVVELRFFGGLSIEEAAEVMGIGRNTAVRRWRAARAWLKKDLGPEARIDATALDQSSK